MKVTLRSGKELQKIRGEENELTEKEDKMEAGTESEQNNLELTKERRKFMVQQEQLVEEGKLKKKEEVRVYVPLVPFPQRLQKSKIDDQFSKFLNMFKKIEVNIPFAEALNQMPYYSKFMKDILSKKRKLDEEGVVSLSATSSAVIQKTLSMNIQDPGSFTIPCTIGNYEFGKALCDSEARINLMPQSIVKKLSLGELTPITMAHQMENRTMAQPKGIFEDALIKVGKFIFLVDFVVIDMEEDN